MNPHETYKGLIEFCEIIKSVEFVIESNGNSREFRIDVKQKLTSKKFSTSVYVRDSFTIQPTFNQVGGSFSPECQINNIWVADTSAAWVECDTLDQAINQTLSFLCQNS